MPDDVKLQLGIDVAALQKSASEATNILTQAFEKNISASVLGNGLTSTQGATAATGQKDTLRGVVDALERVQSTLVAGFNSLAGGVYVGGGGGGGGGAGAGAGGGGGGGGLPMAPATPGTNVPGGRMGVAGQLLSRGGDLAAALMPSSMRMFMGGFYGTDVMGFVHNLVSQIPVAGKLLGAVTGPFHQVMQQNDEFKNMQYETYRDAGKTAMDAFSDMWTKEEGGGGRFNDITAKYGFSRAETQQLVGAGYGNGLNFGSGMDSVLNMQGALGLGSQAAATGGAFQKAGLAKGDTDDALASAIGVAVATGLERGRWGEMLSMWQRAAQSSIDTDIAKNEVLRQQAFIGSLGNRFKGDTPAAQSIDQALRGMASGENNPLAILDAMKLSGDDYATATARMEAAGSAASPDTALEEAAFNRFSNMSAAQTYLNAPSDPGDVLLHKASLVMGTVVHLPRLRIETLLKAKKAAKGGSLFKGISAQDMSTAKLAITPPADVFDRAVGIALGPRRSQTESQRPSSLTEVQGQGDSDPRVTDGGAGAGTGEAPPPSRSLTGRFTTTQSSAAASPTRSVSRLSDLSPDDIRSAAEIAGVPAETMRSWFQIESGGRVGETDGSGAYGTVRGYAQMNREEAALVGVTGSDFNRLSTDKAYSLQKSAELAKKYLERARQDAPAGWGEGDVLHMMKLEHAAGRGGARSMLSRFERNTGRSPASWNELFREEAPLLSGGVGHGQLGSLLNANKLEVVITVDQTGRVAGTRVKAPVPGNTGSPGQLVGGGR